MMEHFSAADLVIPWLNNVPLLMWCLFLLWSVYYRHYPLFQANFIIKV